VDEALHRLALDVLAQGPANPPSGTRLLAARQERWVVVEAELGVVVKAFAPDPGWRGLVARLGLIGSRARRAEAATVRARARGVPMPEPRALVEGPTGSALVSAEIAGARDLKPAFFGASELIEQRRLVRAVAELLRRTHEAKLYPSDFNDTNVLIAEDGAPVLIDPDGLRTVLRVSERRRVRNLARLFRGFAGTEPADRAVSRATCFRFLLAYAGSSAGARRLWRRVAARLEARAREGR
jgi:hypothetical protein